ATPLIHRAAARPNSRCIKFSMLSVVCSRRFLFSPLRKHGLIVIPSEMERSEMKSRDPAMKPLRSRDGILRLRSAPLRMTEYLLPSTCSFFQIVGQAHRLPGQPTTLFVSKLITY